MHVYESRGAVWCAPAASCTAAAGAGLDCVWGGGGVLWPVLWSFITLLSPTYRPRPWGPHRTPPFMISKGPATLITQCGGGAGAGAAEDEDGRGGPGRAL